MVEVGCIRVCVLSAVDGRGTQKDTLQKANSVFLFLSGDKHRLW